jgi:hypothetical protein
MNSEMFKFGMLMLTRRENVDMSDADITVGYMLQPAARALVDEREKAAERD